MPVYCSAVEFSFVTLSDWKDRHNYVIFIFYVICSLICLILGYWNHQWGPIDAIYAEKPALLPLTPALKVGICH